jgi:tyrosyl-tRNA synthetase
MILQALDFLHLYETRNCTLQVAGSDQWGNITSGIELIRRKIDKTAYGMVAPLVTDSTGKKFGKTEGNALWLDINKTSSYQMYQYLINLEDSMIIEYLKKLTFIAPEEIMEIEKQHNEAPHLRIAQKRLAQEIITDLHGEEEFRKAVGISEAFFSGNFKSLSPEQLKDAFYDMPVNPVEEGTPLVDALVNTKIASSKREAREFIKNGSISINGEKNQDLEKVLSKADTLDGETAVIRKGKKNYFIIKI